MALQAKLVQKMSQSLLMTPQLQQAIKLLQLGRLEYIEAIQKEILENPVLEEAAGEESGSEASPEGLASQESPNDPRIEQRSPSMGDATETPTATATPESTPFESDDYLDNLGYSRESTVPRGTCDTDDYPSVDQTLTRSETITEHLVNQLRMMELSDHDLRCAFSIIGNLDSRGYLAASLEELAADAQVGTSDIERVLTIVQNLDPRGIASRDLRECLLIQLDARGLRDSLAARIVEHHLDLVEKQRLDQIASKETTTIEQVRAAVGVLRTLEPSPARPFADHDTRYAIPDIYVHKDGSEYVITLNEDGLPRLRVNPHYLTLLKNAEQDGTLNRSYLTDRLKSASWLIKSIHQRQSTIYKVTASIVKYQREFLDHGISRLRPLVLREVADDIGMHESTVSRVTTNKFVHTPQGVFELKFFFTNAIKTSNGDVSSSVVKERIKAIISAEEPSKPVSDQEIAEILQRDKIEIARRTVAKYREALHIPPSSQRKRMAETGV